jgi:hypothetical protein
MTFAAAWHHRVDLKFGYSVSSDSGQMPKEMDSDWSLARLTGIHFIDLVPAMKVIASKNTRYPG